MIPAISGALGQLNPSEWGVGSIGSVASAQSNPAGQAGAGSFSGALSNALGSLETTQANATQDATVEQTSRVVIDGCGMR